VSSGRAGPLRWHGACFGAARAGRGLHALRRGTMLLPPTPPPPPPPPPTRFFPRPPPPPPPPQVQDVPLLSVAQVVARQLRV
jgi:hypothetical protein